MHICSGYLNEKHHVVLCFVYAAADHPTGLAAEQLPQEPGSFRVSWTPPASLTNLTGYRIYYSGADDSGSMDVGASATEVTIDNRIAGVTYSITMVALSPHLPSPVVGPVTITLGEYNLNSNFDKHALLCNDPCQFIVLLKSLWGVTWGKKVKHS